MTATVGCRGIRQSLGVYVLGAIDPAERAEVDEHLATCLDCREELAALAGLPALLRKIPLTEAERITEPDSPDAGGPSEELLHSLLARTTRVRRTRRWRGLAAAAAAVVVALGGGAVAMNAFQTAGTSVAQDHIHWHTVAHTDAVTGAGMSVRYASRPWGTLLNIEVNGIPPGTNCTLQVVNAAGQRLTVGDWRVSYAGGHVWYPASTAVPDASLRSFQLTSGGRMLVKVPAPPES